MKVNTRGGRGRGSRGSRGRGGRGAGRNASQRGGKGKGRDFESNDQSRRKNNTAGDEDSDDSSDSQYRDVVQVFNGFNGDTVFNQKNKLEKKEYHDISKRGAIRSVSVKGSVGRGRGNRRITKDKRQRDPVPVFQTAKTGKFHVSENKTEVYDFSKFSESDFARKPDFRRGEGASRGGRRGGGRGSFRGGRGTNAENPKRKMDVHNDNESPPKRSRPTE